jgi:hypothetical protein
MVSVQLESFRGGFMQCGFSKTKKECNDKCRYFNTCTRNPVKYSNIVEKIQVVITSLEAEADFCHSVAEHFERTKKYEEATRIRIKEETFRDCVSMLKEELGLM